MKWWHWLILELLIIFGVMAWIYFFPSEDIYDDFGKGLIGSVLFCCVEEIRKRMGENYTVEQNAGENQNEWHYPLKGEYPKDNSFVLVWTEDGGITTNYGEEYSDGISENGLFQGIHISDVIAWKEIVLPKEIKEK